MKIDLVSSDDVRGRGYGQRGHKIYNSGGDKYRYILRDSRKRCFICGHKEGSWVMIADRWHFLCQKCRSVFIIGS